MDPNAAIQLAIDAADQGDREAFVEAMADYKTWVARGGFAADDDLIERATEIIADRLLVEAEIEARKQGIPPIVPVLTILCADMTFQLSQDIEGRMAVLEDPIPDTVEGIRGCGCPTCQAGL